MVPHQYPANSVCRPEVSARDNSVCALAYTLLSHLLGLSVKILYVA